MIPPFPPQLFILLGVDVFLGGSVVAVIFDEHLPTALPYLFDFGSMIGFLQLVFVSRYITTYSVALQFYYCAAFAAVAVVSVLGANLYVALVAKKVKAGLLFAAMASVPFSLTCLYLLSAFVNGISVTLPRLPFVSWTVVWGAFIAASAVLVLAAVAVNRADRSSVPADPRPDIQASQGAPADGQSRPAA